MRIVAAMVGAAFLLSSCNNSCQTLCVRLAKYADECGYPVTQAELTACIDEQAGSESRDDRATCREFGDVETLRAQWTCDDMAIYWEDAGTGS